MSPATLAGLSIAISCVVAVVALAVRVRNGVLDAADVKLGSAIRAKTPRWLLVAAAKLTDLGSIKFVGVAVIATALVGQWQAAVFVGLGSLAAWLTSDGLKRMFMRARPHHTTGEKIPIHEPKGSSFPSVHATTSAALAVLATSVGLVPWPIALAYAAFVALSRIWVGVHHPSDVLAGACVGTAVGLTIALGAISMGLTSI